MVDATFALNLVETVGILVGVSIAIMEIRKSREERRNQVLDQLFQLGSSFEYTKHWTSFVNNSEFSNYDEWSEKYGAYTNPEAFTHWLSFLRYHELIGQRVISGLIDLDIALINLDPVSIIGIWEKSKPIINEWRKRYNLPSFFNGFEFLHDEMRKIYPDFAFNLNPQRHRLMQR
jgi:hypothetical protein